MQKTQDAVLFGAGHFAEVAHYYLTKDSEYRVAAFSVDRQYLQEKEKFGVPVVRFEDLERVYSPNLYKMFVAVGYSNQNQTRQAKYEEAKKKGFELISYVCSKAIVWDDVKIGENCFIFEANVIQPFVEIGDDVIIWSGNHIGHHTSIASHCFVASHAVISGNVKIQPHCFIGVNATLRDGVTIAEGSLIGADALIVKDTEPWSVYGGHPAQLLRKAEKGAR